MNKKTLTQYRECPAGEFAAYTSTVRSLCRRRPITGYTTSTHLMHTRMDGYRSVWTSCQWQQFLSAQIRTFVVATNSFCRRSPGANTKRKQKSLSVPHHIKPRRRRTHCSRDCVEFFYSSIVVFLFVYCFLFFLVHQPPCRVRAVRKEVEDLRTPSQVRRGFLDNATTTLVRSFHASYSVAPLFNDRI